MRPRIDTRIYTNMILTVIAVVMLAGAARDLGIGFSESAQAQERHTIPDLKRTGTGSVVDGNIPQTQDVAVAAATSQVAAANLEIAAAIRELADAVKDGTKDLRSGMENAAKSRGSSSAAAPASTNGTEPPVIEMSR